MSSNKPSSTYNQDEKNTLLHIARASIEHGLELGGPLLIDTLSYSEKLQQPRATFVTLKINDTLRGCIGTLIAKEPLVNSIAHSAWSAAFEDPRFERLSMDEFDKISISLSILSPAEPIEFDSETDLISKIRPGIDGLILEEGYNRFTFLPSVWESLPDAEIFLQHLKQKAGLPPSYWSESIKVERYTAEAIE